MFFLKELFIQFLILSSLVQAEGFPLPPKDMILSFWLPGKSIIRVPTRRRRHERGSREKKVTLFHRVTMFFSILEHIQIYFFLITQLFPPEVKCNFFLKFVIGKANVRNFVVSILGLGHGSYLDSFLQQAQFIICDFYGIGRMRQTENKNVDVS